LYNWTPVIPPRDDQNTDPHDGCNSCALTGASVCSKPRVYASFSSLDALSRQKLIGDEEGSILNRSCLEARISHSFPKKRKMSLKNFFHWLNMVDIFSLTSAMSLNQVNN